jgi:Tc toxin complex TcA C-terminal TcB-binding domain/Neuraminidase-like domain
MYPINATIQPGESNSQVANLQDVLVLLLERQIISATDESALIEQFRAERANAVYGEATRNLVQRFQLQQGLDGSLAGAVEQTTATALNTLVNQQIDGEMPYCVEGAVCDPLGKSVTGTHVRAFDQEFSQEQLLGEAQTDSQGRYRIDYTLQQLSRPGKPAADLLIKVFGTDEALLAVSALTPNAPARATIDLTIDHTLSEPTEYEQLVEAITPRLNGKILADLTPKDVSFLATVTGQDEKRIGLLVESARCARDLFEDEHIPSAIFYGWFRQGIPSQLTTLLAQNKEQLGQALSSSIAAKIVPDLAETHRVRLMAASTEGLRPSLATSSEEVVDSRDWQDILTDVLRQKQVEYELRPSTRGQRLTVTDLFGAPTPRTEEIAALAASISQPQNVLTEDKQRILAESVAAGDGVSEKLWIGLKENGFEDWEVGMAQRGYALADLTQNHLPLVRTLQQMEPINSDQPSGTLKFLARLNEEDWQTQVSAIGVPDSIVGATEEERQAKYAANLEQTIESAFPTAVVAERIKQDRFAVDASAKPDLVTFFDNNQEFTFGKHYVQVFLGDEGEANTAGVKDLPALKHNLLKMERSIKLAGGYREQSALLAQGFDSAQKIARYGRRDFTNQLSAHPAVPKESAEVIFARAEQTAAMATTLLMKYRDSGINLPVMATTNLEINALDMEAQAALRQIPDLRTLFGSLDSCACESCLSVYSPAAYFVDLLHYLGDRQIFSSFRVSPQELVFPPEIQTTQEIVIENTGTLPIEVTISRIGSQYGIEWPDLPPTTLAAGAQLRHPVTNFASEGDQVSATVRVRARSGGNDLPDQLVNVRANVATGSSPSLVRFVDLRVNVSPMREGGSLLDFLLSRRPDLSEIELSCENSNTLMPYVDLVMEILEQASGTPFPHSIDVLNADAVEQSLNQRVIPDALRIGMNTIYPRLSENTTVETVGSKLWWLRDDARKLLIRRSATNVQQFELVSVSLQTSDRPQELATNPAHTNVTAYQALKEAVYPWHLPFDLWSEEARIYLTHLGVPLHMLQQTFYSDENWQQPELGSLGIRHWKSAPERLGLTPDEASIISGQKTNIAPWAFWGFSAEILSGEHAIPDPSDRTKSISGNWVSVLMERIDVVLQQSGLSYEQLREVLDMRFVNSDENSRYIVTIQLGTIVLQENPQKETLTCDLSKAKLIRVGSEIVGDVEGVLERMHRFIKLWRKLGWSMLDVDCALSSQQLAELLQSPNALEFLSVIDWTKTYLTQRFQLANHYQNTVQLNTIQYSDYQVEGNPAIKSLYEDLFLNKSLPDAPEAFQLQANRKEIKGVDQECLLYQSHIAAACRLSIQDTQRLIAAGEPTLSLQALTRLFFAARAAHGARLSIWEFLELRALIQDIVPFQVSASTASVVSDVAFAIMNAGMSPSEVIYLLSHKKVANDSDTDSKNISFVLDGLRQALNTVTGGSPAVALERRSDLISIVEEKLANTLGFESRVMSRLLNDWILSSSSSASKAIDDFLDPAFVESQPDIQVAPEGFARQFQSYIRLSKIATLTSKFKLTYDTLNWLFAPGAEISGWLNLNQLPATTDQPAVSVKGLLRLFNLLEVRSKIPGGENTLTQLFTLATKSETTAQLLTQRLSEFTGWSLADLQELLSIRGFNLTTDDALKNALKDEWLLHRLIECFSVLKRLGASAAQCLKWSKFTIGPDEVGEIKRLARSRYNDAGWQDVAKPLRNALREKQRQSLVSYLIAKQQLRDSNDLYSQYLIDVEMSPCSMTSRIKQAAASVQLFVQRCLLNLEPAVPPSAIDTELWSWMKNYRVWEANRKVFLYPENWLEPELRDDKTPFFQDIESALLQDDVKTETAENALHSYLNRLTEVSRLDIRSICNESSTNNVSLKSQKLHLFARTFSSPHIYFHRFRDNTSDLWSPWQRIEANIEGDFILSNSGSGKIFLFWITLTEKASEVSSQSEVPTKYWEARLAWTYFVNGKWQSSTVSPITLNTELPTNKYTKDKLIFLKSDAFPVDPLRIFIDLWAAEELKNPNKDVVRRPVGFFSFDFESLKIETNKFPSDTIFGTVARRDNTRLYFKYQRYEEIATIPGEDSLKMYYRYEVNKPVRIIDILQKTPGTFYLIGIDLFETDSSLLSFYPFVYQDGGVMNSEMNNSGYHSGSIDRGATFVVDPVLESSSGKMTKLNFGVHFHPMMNSISKQFSLGGTSQLLSLNNQSQGSWPSYFVDRYGSVDVGQGGLVDVNSMGDFVDFSLTGSYSVYNWEIFFHSVLLVANNLSKNQRFEEAHRWFQYIFDPTTNSKDPSPGRFWQFLPFHKASVAPKSINELMAILASNRPEDQKLREELQAAIADWRTHPFEPHRIARLRTSAYQWSVIMKYLDNLIAWGDQLFRRDTIEAINEATQIYILVSEILGERPRKVKSNDRTKAKTYSQIAPTLDDFSNVLVQVEALVQTPNGQSPGVPAPPIPTTLYTSYFCIPPNEKLANYWDTVEDRLFKVRNCMNIEGVVRQLPLYEPPIDPALLVRARAAGIDLGTALSDLSTPLPFYRFNVHVQKATELCGEVKALGGALLSALEKKDAEQLGLLRTQHESTMLRLVESVRQAQVEDALSAKESLLKSRGSAVSKFLHYERLLGIANSQIPKEGEAIAFLQAPQKSAMLEEAGTKMISSEKEEAQNLSIANDLQLAAGLADVLASYLRLIPENTAGFGGSGVTFGGSHLGSAASLYASFFRVGSAQASYQAARAGKLAGLILRENEWVFQRNQSAHEIMQIDKQLISMDIKIDIAKKELSNHRKQIEHNQEIEDYLRDKFTNEQLYAWMIGKVSSIYFQSYQLAYDVAKRAEKAYRHELGLEDKDSNFIRFGYWDSMKKGLLAGEQLALDIKRLEVAYLDNNKREFELTRHVSLRQLNPLALLALRKTGACEFGLPEWLFDRDCPGHYMRRIKNVAVSIPTVAGPYASVNCTVSLLSSSVRKSSLVKGGIYPRQADDERFTDYAGAIQSIVTSGANNDTGLFETNLRDERFLPFEGAGAIGEWKLELPARYPDYDRATISDVILHIRYTAHPGVDQGKVNESLDALFAETTGANFALLFSIPHDFPSDWSAFVNGTADLSVTIQRDHFPYFTQGREITLNEFQLYAIDPTIHHTIDDPANRTTQLKNTGQFTLTANEDIATPIVLTRTFGNDVFLIISYSVGRVFPN